MRRKVLKFTDGGQGPGCAEALANIKRCIRSSDVRAVAFVVVNSQGVASLYGGHDDGKGFYWALRSGVENLRYRMDKAANEGSE